MSLDLDGLRDSSRGPFDFSDDYATIFDDVATGVGDSLPSFGDFFLGTAVATPLATAATSQTVKEAAEAAPEEDHGRDARRKRKHRHKHGHKHSHEHKKEAVFTSPASSTMSEDSSAAPPLPALPNIAVLLRRGNGSRR